MRRDEIADMAAFVVVAEERSFTRAARKLGLSQSALSQIVRRLEEKLGLRLLARTTRSVAPTQVGERLLATMAPMMRELDASIADLSSMKEKPSGSIRITSVEHATSRYLIPALAPILSQNPEVRVEIEDDYGLKDVVESRFDAGVRLGERVAQDMIAVRISPPVPMSIVASPDYFQRHSPPEHPRMLDSHIGIDLHVPTSDSRYEWKLSHQGKSVHAKLGGQATFNGLRQIVEAALAGVGLANVPLDEVSDHLAAGRLTRVLAEWSEDLPPYYLYYPNRRFPSSAFRLMVEAVKHRG